MRRRHGPGRKEGPSHTPSTSTAGRRRSSASIREPRRTRARSGGELGRRGLDVADAVRLDGEHRPAGRGGSRRCGRPGASSSGGRGRGGRRRRRPRPPSADRSGPRRPPRPCRGSCRPAREKRKTRSPSVVSRSSQPRHSPLVERHHVVEIDQRVDLRQRLAGEHALDQPLDRRPVARPLDAEALVGRRARRRRREWRKAPFRPSARGIRLPPLRSPRPAPPSGRARRVSGSASTKATRKSGNRSTRASMDRRRIGPLLAQDATGENCILLLGPVGQNPTPGGPTPACGGRLRPRPVPVPVVGARRSRRRRDLPIQARHHCRASIVFARSEGAIFFFPPQTQMFLLIL